MKKKVFISIIIVLIVSVGIYIYFFNLEINKKNTSEAFLAELQSMDQQSYIDFSPQTMCDGWFYFFVEDQRSIYRIQPGNIQPQLVSSDSDGAVQISDGMLYYIKKQPNTLNEELVCQNIGQNSPKSITNLSTGGKNEHTRLVISDYIVTQFSNSGVKVKYLECSKWKDFQLKILGEPVYKLLWTNGQQLYYIDEASRLVKKWDFNHTPADVELPTGFSYWTNCKNKMYVKNPLTGEVKALCFADETWRNTEYSGDNSDHVQPFLTPDNKLYLEQGEKIWNFSDNALVIDLEEENLPYCIDLLYADNDVIIYTFKEFHANYETCGCQNADYFHYYIRTIEVSANGKNILWKSDGSNFTLDY